MDDLPDPVSHNRNRTMLSIITVGTIIVRVSQSDTPCCQRDGPFNKLTLPKTSKTWPQLPQSTKDRYTKMDTGPMEEVRRERA